MARILFACAGTLAQQSKISMLLQSIILCPQGSGKPAGDRISISGSPRAQATYYLAGGCTVAVGNKLCLPIGKSLFGLGPGSVPGATNAPSMRTNAPYHRDRFAVCHLATGRKPQSSRYFLYCIVVQCKKAKTFKRTNSFEPVASTCTSCQTVVPWSWIEPAEPP